LKVASIRDENVNLVPDFSGLLVSSVQAYLHLASARSALTRRWRTSLPELT
jgi:hypothetical protein